MKFIDKCVVVLAIFGEIFCILVSITDKLFPLSFYYFLFTGLVGWYVWRHREILRARLSRPTKHPFLRYLALGYGMVLLEEVVAAFANHISLEQFSLATYLIRIPQFWALNILAFTGFILGWYWLSKRYYYSDREWFYLAGIWGIYAEHLYVGGPIMFPALALPTILTYGLIITPARWSLANPGTKHLFAPLKYLLTYVVIFVFSLPTIFILQHLRCAEPDWFPPPLLVAAGACQAT